VGEERKKKNRRKDIISNCSQVKEKDSACIVRSRSIKRPISFRTGTVKPFRRPSRRTERLSCSGKEG